MNIFRRSHKQPPSPFLNLFWPILFLPVAVILYRLWQEKLPWMEEEGKAVTGGEPRTRLAHQEKVPAHKDTPREPASRGGGIERRSPGQKKQKDVPKNERRGGSQDRSEELEVIEGIGPKTAAILRGAGIRTFSQLANTGVDRLNEILREAGIRLNPPDTWPEQARLAADGDWQGLEQLKSQLHAGRRDQDVQ